MTNIKGILFYPKMRIWESLLSWLIFNPIMFISCGKIGSERSMTLHCLSKPSYLATKNIYTLPGNLQSLYKMLIYYKVLSAYTQLLT